MLPAATEIGWQKTPRRQQRRGPVFSLAPVFEGLLIFQFEARDPQQNFTNIPLFLIPQSICKEVWPDPTRGVSPVLLGDPVLSVEIETGLEVVFILSHILRNCDGCSLCGSELASRLCPDVFLFFFFFSTLDADDECFGALWHLSAPVSLSLSFSFPHFPSILPTCPHPLSLPTGLSKSFPLDKSLFDSWLAQSVQITADDMLSQWTLGAQHRDKSGSLLSDQVA